jgi:hypothetical protein
MCPGYSGVESLVLAAAEGKRRSDFVTQADSLATAAAVVPQSSGTSGTPNMRCQIASPVQSSPSSS